MSEILEPNMNGHRKSNGALKVSNIGRDFGQLKTLLTLLTFATGVIVNLLAYNIASTQMVQFSTLGMVGFIMSVTLSSAAVAFTIVTVTLRYIARKDDHQIGAESLRPQNEVTNRTIEAVTKVEASSSLHAH